MKFHRTHRKLIGMAITIAALMWGVELAPEDTQTIAQAVIIVAGLVGVERVRNDSE